jgi:hypothetical protein
MATVFCGSLATAGSALVYFQHVRLERPPIGVFNSRDIVMLLCFIVALPLIYLFLPGQVLTALLVITFMAASYIGLRPLMPARFVWLITLPLLAANIVVTQITNAGWQPGLPLYWILDDIIVLLAAAAVANLYVQGGMRLRHVAWFALILSFYDAFFAFVIPVSQALADRFEGAALDPSIGFAIGAYRANIGLGDLLVFSLFTIAAYKGYGKKAAIAAIALIAIFGAILPSLSPLMIAAVTRKIGITVPAQVFFGPAAFIAYLWLARHAPERSMAQWFSLRDAARHEPADRPVAIPTTPALATAPGAPAPDMQMQHTAS